MLGTAISKEDRLKLESIAKNAFNTFSTDL